MKNVIRSLSLVLLLVVPFALGQAQVGSNVDGTFTATANVISALTVTNLFDLEFNDVIQGQNKSVTANTGTGATVASYGPGQLAQFRVEGALGKEVGAYCAAPQDLSDGSNTLTFANLVAYSNTGNDLTSAATAATPTAWASRIDVTLDGTNGYGYVWFGGEVQPTAAQAVGAYSATNTVTFYYTGN